MPIICAHARQAALTGESGPVKLGGAFLRILVLDAVYLVVSTRRN